MSKDLQKKTIQTVPDKFPTSCSVNLKDKRKFGGL